MSALTNGSHPGNGSSNTGPVGRAGKAGAILRAYALAVLRWYQMRRAIHAVARLDDRMLKDMGIDRSEIERVVTCGRSPSAVVRGDAIARREDRTRKDSVAAQIPSHAVMKRAA
jgi:uncharacterized protein YjiS (DUF1127 family)